MIANTNNTSTLFLTKIPKKIVKVLVINSLMVTLLSVNLGCSQASDDQEQATAPLKVINYMVLGGAHQMTVSDNGIHNTQNYHQTQSIRTLTGQVVASKNTKISFDTQGTITHIYPNLGDRIRKGQVLAKIDATTYQLKYNQAQSQLTQALNEYNKAASDVKRREELLPIGAVSKNEVESVKLTLRTAKESVKFARASVALAKKQLNDTKLIAPISGTITAKLSEVGQYSSPSIPVLAVANEGNKEVSISVPETLLSYIDLGQPMTVSLPALSLKVSATVTEISSQASAGSFPVTLKLIDTPDSVKAGMTAETMFELVQKNVAVEQTESILAQPKHLQNTLSVDTNIFSIPPSALGSQNAVTHTNSDNLDILPTTTEVITNDHYIYKISYNDTDNIGTLHKAIVKVHDFTGKSIMVSGDVKSGDLIVRSGVSLLKDKQNVELIGQGVKRINP